MSSFLSFFDSIFRRARRQAGGIIYSTRQYCDIDLKTADCEAETQERIDDVLKLEAEATDLQAERDRERADFKFR